jgi:KilA-N domain
MAKQKIEIKGIAVRVEDTKRGNYYSLTDLAQGGEGEVSEVIRRWLRAQKTVDFLGVWEEVHNPGFNLSQMGQIKMSLSRENFYISVNKWVEMTGAIGIEARAGRYGGTYAHPDIALHFANWLSPEFYVYLIKEFQRLKDDEAERLGLTWNLRRELAKANYPIHTEAVRTNLVPMIDWNTKREGMHFANEADLLNLAVFGTTARQWREANPDAKGNIRDSATEQELQVLSNMESANALLIDNGFNKEERFAILSKRAARELDILGEVKAAQGLKKLR